ncbi:MAG TPA: hypothetical protein VJ904_04400, partial [Tichowtungia sp.]|nr:hypothetical protein [Tichowtungia sp.]
MSAKPLFKCLTVLLCTLLLAGCITTDVEISLNPDGSGTLKYTRHFDRATDEMRQEIRDYRNKPNVSRGLTEESIRENYPEPHFRLIRFEDNEEMLCTEVV